MTRDEILDALEDGREQFLDAMDDLPDEALLEQITDGGWSLKDILFHLSMWEAELIKLLWQASQGQKPTTAHFQQVNVDATNAAWQALAKERELDRILSDYQSVRKQTVRRVMVFTDQDLNDPKRFPWLKGTPLWQWIESDSFGHEAEHLPDILHWRQQRMP